MFIWTVFVCKCSKASSYLFKAQGQATQFLTFYSRWTFLISMTLVYFLMMLDMSILSTVSFTCTIMTGISDHIRRPSRTSPTSSDRFLTWAGMELRINYQRKSIPALYVDCSDITTSASFQPLTGKMYARFNSKKLFLGFFTIFNIGSAICGAAQTSAMLIAGRFIAGLGGAGLMNGGFTMIHASIPPEKRPGMLGYFMACKWSVTCVMSAFTNKYSWQSWFC